MSARLGYWVRLSGTLLFILDFSVVCVLVI